MKRPSRPIPAEPGQNRMVSLPASLSRSFGEARPAGRFHLAKKIKFTDEFVVPICFP